MAPKSRWNRKMVDLLISLYECYPILYDSQMEGYFNRHMREAAVTSITAKLNKVRPIRAADVKAKMKTLRSQYAVEKANEQRSLNSGTDESYRPTLWCYDSLRFLDRHVKVGKRKNPSNPEELVDAVARRYEHVPLPQDYSLYSVPTDDEFVVSYRKQRKSARNAVVPVSSNKEPKSTSTAIIKLRKDSKVMEIAEDRHDIFGKYIASELRTISDERLLFETKVAIQGIINDAHIRTLDTGDIFSMDAVNDEEDSAVKDEEQGYDYHQI